MKKYKNINNIYYIKIELLIICLVIKLIIITVAILAQDLAFFDLLTPMFDLLTPIFAICASFSAKLEEQIEKKTLYLNRLNKIFLIFPYEKQNRHLRDKCQMIANSVKFEPVKLVFGCSVDLSSVEKHILSFLDLYELQGKLNMLNYIITRRTAQIQYYDSISLRNGKKIYGGIRRCLEDECVLYKSKLGSKERSYLYGPTDILYFIVHQLNGGSRRVRQDPRDPISKQYDECIWAWWDAGILQEQNVTLF